MGTGEPTTLTDERVDERTGERTMVIRTVPGIKLPRLVRGVVPNGRVEFVDTRRYRAGAEKTFPFAQEFTTLNNITKHSVVRGTITVTETGEKSCVVDVKGWSSTDNGENVIAFFRAFPRVSASGVRANRRARANETSFIDVTRARERGVVE